MTGLTRAAARLGQAQERIRQLGGRTAGDAELASILGDLEDALTEAQMTQDELTRQRLPALPEGEGEGR
jgi:hypothetical protein